MKKYLKYSYHKTNVRKRIELKPNHFYEDLVNKDSLMSHL